MSPQCLRSFLVAGAALLAGCKTPPRDPFLRAEQAMERRELAAALSAYDAVPVAHPRYPEARAAAAAVEQSMRHGHELLLEALQLRGQWRDDEALVALERARSVWPAMPGLDALVAATSQRQILLPRGSGRSVPPTRPPGVPLAEVVVVDGATVAAEPLPPESSVPVTREAPSAPSSIELRSAVPPPAPVAEPAGADLRSSPESRLQVDPPSTAAEPPSGTPPGGELPVASPPTAAAIAINPTAQLPVAAVPPTSSPSATVHPAEDPVSRALVAIELRLARREAEPAVAELIDLHRSHPDDLRIRLRLAKLLHQRALLRYGSGAIDPAIRDWERVLTLDPQHADARAFLAVAVGERECPR